MLSSTIAIHWHDDGHPVYSLDFQPLRDQSRRLATAGGDKNVRIWRIQISDTGEPQETSVEYLSTLRKHSQAVNAVRFNPDGKLLASAGDDGMLIIWSLASNIVQEFGVQDDDMKESWIVHQSYNTNLEIYDICWSPDSKFVAAGSMDNTTKIYNIITGQKVSEMSNHLHYVQGIAWDPLNGFIATQSADRSVNIHSFGVETESSSPVLSVNLHSKLIRAEMPTVKLSDLPRMGKPPTMPTGPREKEEQCSGSQYLPNEKAKEAESTHKNQITKKTSNLYHSENLQSFFRRLNFSPDGSLLLVPLGICKYEGSKGSNPDGIVESVSLNTVYIYTRAGLNQPPVCHLPGLPKPAIAVAFSPLMFQLSTEEIIPLFSLPYKMVFAVATHDSVIIYDTERLQPLGILSNLHYLSITDLCWDNNGQSLMVSSAEGFCSVITFDKKAFGPTLEENLEKPKLYLGVTVNATEKSHTARSQSGPSQNEDNKETGLKFDPTEAAGLNKSAEKVNTNVPNNSNIESTLSSEVTNAAITVGSNKASEFNLNNTNTTDLKHGTPESLHDRDMVSQYQIRQFMANPVIVHDANCITLEVSKRTESDANLSEPPKKKRISPTLINRS